MNSMANPLTATLDSPQHESGEEIRDFRAEIKEMVTLLADKKRLHPRLPPAEWEKRWKDLMARCSRLQGQTPEGQGR